MLLIFYARNPCFKLLTFVDIVSCLSSCFLPLTHTQPHYGQLFSSHLNIPYPNIPWFFAPIQLRPFKLQVLPPHKYISIYILHSMPKSSLVFDSPLLISLFSIVHPSPLFPSLEPEPLSLSLSGVYVRRSVPLLLCCYFYCCLFSLSSFLFQLFVLLLLEYYEGTSNMTSRLTLVVDTGTIVILCM
jgi:hypothetical protein